MLSNVTVNSEKIVENIGHLSVCEQLDSNSINTKDTSCRGKHHETSGILLHVDFLKIFRILVRL